MEFDGERAVDCGGVSRDMFAGFWEQLYGNLFDGSTLLTPVLHPQVDMSILLGRILSHGFFACGFIPVRIAFPTLVMMLKGTSSVIPDCIILNMFPDTLSEYDASIIREA